MRGLVLLLICIVATSNVALVAAQPPIDKYAPFLSIISPPDPPNRYENSTVELELNVRLVEGSPQPKNFSYNIDGGPAVDLTNATTSHKTTFMPYVFTLYSAKVKLENLSEGNHTIDAYSDGLHVSRSFRVNSNYHPTTVKLLSPLNQTYSGGVPLVFTVNMPITGAYYYMYRGYDAVFERHFNGNTTLDNLADGDYVLHLYVQTENGAESASTGFSISNDAATDYPLYAIGLGVLLVVALGWIVYSKHIKRDKQAVRQVSG